MADSIPMDGHYKIACILGVGSPFYLSIARGAQAAANASGVTLLVDAPADFDASLQSILVDAYAMQDIQALIIAPCDNQALIAPLQRASDAGIHVITVDAYIGDGNYSDGPVTFPLSYIGSDNLLGGRLGGEAMLKILGGTGTVYIQSTMPGLSATDLREQGFQEVLASAGGHVTVQKIGYDHGSIEQSAEQTRAMMRAYPALSAIFSTGDYSTRGVLEAIQQEGQSGRINIVRFDAPARVIADLRDGLIDAVIAQLPQEMGRLAVEQALQALAGHIPPKQIKTGLVVIDRDTLDTPQAQSVLY